MNKAFPTLPDFGFSWRSLQVEPVRHSGERITLGAVVKADEGAVFVSKFLNWGKLKTLYGESYGRELEQALSICVSNAKKHFEKSPIFSNWEPPIEGFLLGETKHSLANDMSEAILVAGRLCSSISFASQIAQPSATASKASSVQQVWSNGVLTEVGEICPWVTECFDARVDLKTAGMQIRVGLLTQDYAAQFEAVSSSSSIPTALLRAQAKLWQLDLLREGDFLFKPRLCELILGIPRENNAKTNNKIREFVEEIEYESEKRGLGTYATSSATDAARRVIEKAAAGYSRGGAGAVGRGDARAVGRV